MDVAAMSIALNQSQLKLNANLAVMNQAKQLSEQTGEQFIEMLKNSAPHPNLGKSVDVSV